MPTMEHTPAGPAGKGRSAALLLRTLAWLAALATLAGVGRHLAEGLLAARPVAPAAWLCAGLHLAAALGSLGLGYLVLSLAYPRRGLAREAAANPAAALQAGSHLFCAALLAGASWGGTDPASLLVSAVFWTLGVAGVALVLAGHRLVTRYRDHEEVAAGNVAAALASAGLAMAVGLVVGRAILGQFAGWRDSLAGFGVAAAWVLALYPLRQVLLARVLLGMTPRELDEAVSLRRDAWLGLAEAAFYVVAALCLSAAW